MRNPLLFILLAQALLSSCTSTSGQQLSSSSSFATPNILNNASFEGEWDGFTDWSGNPLPKYVSLDNTTASAGSWSVSRSWVPNPNGDTGSQFLYHFGNADRIWVRFYFKLTAPITTQMKFARFYDSIFNNHYGGFYIAQGNYIVAWGWDAEDAQITTDIGLTESQVIDGNWHSLEVDYWRNGDPSGFPSVAFWFDGRPLGLPDGTPTHYFGGGNNSYWKGGRLYAGERVSSDSLGYQEWLATLNGGNTTTGQVNLDQVSYSTLGRIGP